MSDSEELAPVLFEWDGDAMVPIPQQKALANEQYVVHERYRLVEIKTRRQGSHNHYFAALNEAHKNLSDSDLMRFPKAEHLRKWALIQTGWLNRTEHPCATKAEADRWAARMKARDEFAVVFAQGDVVVEINARSQSYRAMGKEDFQKSKWDVLNKVAELIGVSGDDLRRNAGRSA